jgi:hypothetical protein
MAFTADGLTEQRTDLWADITHVYLFDDTWTSLAVIPKSEFLNVADGTTGAISFEINVTGSDVGVGNTVSQYRITDDETNGIVIAEGAFSTANTASTEGDLFQLTFTIDNQ